MSNPVVRDELREPLRRVLGWLLQRRDGAGRIVCPDHGIEHTGKSAGAAVLAAELVRLGEPDREALYGVALEQGRRMVARLEPEGTSDCHTFRPGRHDPYNCSNNIIDGGACSDALAELVRTFGEQLPAADREAFAAASLLHARGYLRFAVIDKGIPAQRAWGLTGLAGAWSLEPDPELERAGLEAIDVLARVQNGDGSYPYHPLEWGAEHAGASDASAFYQSRVTGFLVFALERLGRDPAGEPFRRAIERGLDFLLALQGPDGIKCGLVEAKPWYWGATHEVASHPFDVWTLARGWRHLGDPRLAAAAVRAFRAWVEHLEPGGRPRSHLDGPGRRHSFQCPVFWAAHASWMARAAGDLEAILSRAGGEPEGEPGPRVAHFPDVDLVRLEDQRIVAWVRGRRPGFNVHHGSPHGAGLLRVVRRADGRELLARCRHGGRQEGEWSGRFGAPSLGRGWRSGRAALRFSLWLARTHWRAGRTLEAVRTPPRVFRDGVLAFGAPRVASAFCTEAAARVVPRGVEVEGALARRDGSPVPGSLLQRGFRVDGAGLLVRDRLVEPGPARGVEYRLPAAAREVAQTGGEVSYRLA